MSVMNGQPHTLGVSSAWIAKDSRDEWVETFQNVTSDFLYDPAWAAWLGEHQNFPAESHVVTFDDTPTRKVRVGRIRKAVTLTVPADEVAHADRAGRLPTFFSDLFVDLFTRWAAARNITSPPPAPSVTA